MTILGKLMVKVQDGTTKEMPFVREFTYFGETVIVLFNGEGFTVTHKETTFRIVPKVFKDPDTAIVYGKPFMDKIGEAGFKAALAKIRGR